MACEYLAVLGLAAEILQQLPGPLLVAIGGAQEVDMGVADRLAVTGRAVHLDLAGVRRLRGIVGDIQAVVVVGPAIDVLARAERFRRTGELRLQRFGIGEVFLEGLDPPFQRLARDRAGTELVVALLVEEHAAAVPGHLVPGARQLLEPDAGDPEDRVVRDLVLLRLAQLLEQFVVGLERFELRLLHQVGVVVPHPDRGEVRQAHQLAVVDRAPVARCR